MKWHARYGFKNINVDLMLGLPNQDLETLENSLKEVISLKLEHISIYSLILEEGTKLEKEVKQGTLKMIDEALERKMYWRTKEILEKSGYIHYEISNFAKPNFESKHNLSCWNQEEYIGFGVASHSYLDKKRFSNTNSIEEYIDNINKGNFGKNITINEVQDKEAMRKRIYAARFKKNRWSKY